MDLAVKKVELINWLTKQDEVMIDKIENLRKSAVKSIYDEKMSEGISAKLVRSHEDIIQGRIHSQDKVETYFKSKFNH
jgi:hypothetical protein